MAEQLTRRDLLRKGATFSAAAAVALATPAAFAQEPVALPEEEYFKVQALDWSKNNNGIAVALSMSSDSPYTAQWLASQINNGITQLNNGEEVKTSYFARIREDNGSNAISFFVRGVPYGPYDVEGASQSLTQVVEDLKSVQQARLDQDGPGFA